MSNRVNPPEQLTLPPEVASNVQLKKAFDDRDFILFQLWKRLGGGADYVFDNQTSIENIPKEFDDLYQPETAKNQLKDDYVAVTSDYTTIGDQTIICNNAVTVFLNDEPDDRELVKVLVVNGDVIIDGNGRPLNKSTSQTVLFNNLITLASVVCVYILEIDEWFIV